MSRFTEAGIAAKEEPYALPLLWLPVHESLALVSPGRATLRVAACPGSPEPRGGRVEAPVVDAGSGDDEALGLLGGTARGAILLVRYAPQLDARRLSGRVEAARAAGAAALLVESTRDGDVLERRPVAAGDALASLPAAVVTKGDFEKLRTAAARGGARAGLELSVRVQRDAPATNVVAAIPGSKKPQEWVLLAAHLDSWDLGTGALDDGVNAALVLDVARGFKELGFAPSRTVRFALFTGEEQEMRGSLAYVTAHAKELGGLVAAVVYDLGTGRTRGFYTGKRRELRPAVNEASRALPPPAFLSSLDSAYAGTDSFPFLLAGAPTLVANQELTGYSRHRHAETDVFARIDDEEARRNAATASALVAALTERAEPPPASLPPAEAAARLRRAGVDVPEALAARFSALFGR